MYKITFELKGSVFLTERINFDGLIAWAYLKHKEDMVAQSVVSKNIIEFEGLIPIKYKDGIPIASSIFFEKENLTEWVDYWRKKWESKTEYFVNMERGTPVKMTKGNFKSYDTPMNLKLIDRVWFYFDTDDLNFLEELLKHIVGLGKKRNHGKGEIKKYVIEEIDMDFFDEVRRPLPLRLVDMKNYNSKSFEIRNMRCKTPYWTMLGAEPCLIPIDYSV